VIIEVIMATNCIGMWRVLINQLPLAVPLASCPCPSSQKHVLCILGLSRPMPGGSRPWQMWLLFFFVIWSATLFLWLLYSPYLYKDTKFWWEESSTCYKLSIFLLFNKNSFSCLYCSSKVFYFFLLFLWIFNLLFMRMNKIMSE
jgi:hypothetical protein